MVKVVAMASEAPGHLIPAITLLRRFKDEGCDAKLLSQRSQKTLDFAARHDIETIEIDLPDRELRAKEIIRYLHQTSPDITICDWCPEFWFALQFYRPKCSISLLRTELLKGYERINIGLTANINADDAYLEFVNGKLKEFNPESSGLRSIEELYRADIIAIPSIPLLDPIPEPVDSIYSGSEFIYTGPLTLPEHVEVSDETVQWINQRKVSGHTVVLTTLGTMVHGSVYQSLFKGLAGSNLAVVLVTPDTSTRDFLSGHVSENIRILDFCPLGAVIQMCDLVFHHGGHATNLLAIRAEKPSLIMPTGEFDREDNAVRLEELNLGQLLDSRMFRHKLDVEAFSALASRILRDRTVANSLSHSAGLIREFQSGFGAAAIVAAARQRVCDTNSTLG